MNVVIGTSVFIRDEQGRIKKEIVTMPPADVPSAKDAFGVLCKELERRLKSIQVSISNAAQQGDYAKAEQYLKQAQALTSLRDDLAALEQRFNRLVEPALTSEIDTGKRLPRGLKTPLEEHKAPILRALVELGGSAEINVVLDRVYELMKDGLNEYDLAPIPSDETTPRWRNTAQWARNRLREAGLIRDDTARGFWAISDTGRRWLEQHQ